MTKENLEMARNALRAIVIEAIAIQKSIADFYIPLRIEGVEEEQLDWYAFTAKEIQDWAETLLEHL